MFQPEVQELIASRYAAAHGATVHLDYPYSCVVADEGIPRAALGYRFADEGMLFLERYLDSPIERSISVLLDRQVERARIVEIGAHASSRSRATVALWATAAEDLGDVCEVAVAVLTAPLRAMFAKVGLEIVAIAPALGSLLGGEVEAWGQYYEADPIVCAGLIGPARNQLARLGRSR